MAESAGIPDFESPVIEHARKDFPLLNASISVAQALDQIRREGVGERVIYFYAVDDENHLVGVLPTRRLLTAPLDSSLREIMVPRVIAIPAKATVLDACEFFVLYKFFAFPVVDEQRRIVGVIDVSLFAEGVLEAGDRKEEKLSPAPVRDGIFEALGFHIEQVRTASPLLVFGYRFRWLLVTVAAGTICALLAGLFQATLARALVLAFFLTIVLGLNESVSAQSMSVTIQALRTIPVTWRWFANALRREFSSALLLGLACGILVGAIVWLWRGNGWVACVIAGTIALSVVNSCLIGLSVPSLLHRLKLDPKIAAGPVALALADIMALVIYFTCAWLVLR